MKAEDKMLRSCFDSQGTIKNDVFDELVQEYRPMIYSYAKKYYLPGGEAEDLYQWGLIGLYKAVLKYEESEPYSFNFIASINIKNMIKTSLTMANRQKHLAMNTSLSLCYVDDAYKSNDSREYMDRVVLSSTHTQDPLEVVVAQESANRIQHVIDNRLSKSERSIVLLYVKGYKQRHIAEELNYHPKFVDNALQRARKKIHHFVGLQSGIAR